MFLFGALVLVMAYLIYEHKRVAGTTTPGERSNDITDDPVSASAVPGDMVGPGATSNTPWYTPQQAHIGMIP
jgi:hypothetical protein